MDAIPSWLTASTSFLFDLQSRFALIYISATILIAYALWLVRGRPGTFLTWLIPRTVYLHRSNLMDVKIFLVNLLLSVSGFFAAISFTPVITIYVLSGLVALSGEAYQPEAVSWGKTLIATVVMILTLDFCKYWAHKLHHESRVLWPFHALHHSAEVMTPLTALRNHPFFLVIRGLIFGVIVGIVQALMLFLLVGKIDIFTIGSVNIGFFLFNLLGSNFRHSHIWFSFGPVLEHIFISPAQHHIHHSADKKHHNKNYGEVFAFWDLIFGTLYIPKGHEILTFGLADAEGNLLPQPHETLREALLHPFVESWQELWEGTSYNRNAPARTDAHRSVLSDQATSP